MIARLHDRYGLTQIWREGDELILFDNLNEILDHANLIDRIIAGTPSANDNDNDEEAGEEENEELDEADANESGAVEDEEPESEDDNGSEEADGLDCDESAEQEDLKDDGDDELESDGEAVTTTATTTAPPFRYQHNHRYCCCSARCYSSCCPQVHLPGSARARADQAISVNKDSKAWALRCDRCGNLVRPRHNLAQHMVKRTGREGFKITMMFPEEEMVWWAVDSSGNTYPGRNRRC